MIGLAIAAVLCCTPDGPVDSARRRDSAGVAIVESSGPRWRDGDAWTIDHRPLLAIGEDSGTTAPQFSLVRGMRRLADGRLVVSDDNARQLFFFDPAGHLLKAIGGRGQGPGEFGYSLMRIWPGPDGTLLVGDDGNARINIFDDTGAFVRAARFAPLPDVPRVAPIGVFDDGTLLASGVVGSVAATSERPRTLVTRDHSWFRYSVTGEQLERILTRSGRPSYVSDYAGGVGQTAVPLTPDLLVAARANGLLLYRGPKSQIEEWSTDGRLRRVMRWESAPPRRVTDVWDRYKETYVEREGITPLGRQYYAHFFSLDLPLPELVPSTERLIVDSDDNIWAQRYRLPWETDLQWDIISHNGHYLGTLTSPPNLTIYQIGPDFVLGTYRDSIGVQSVRMHSLRRPALAPSGDERDVVPLGSKPPSP
jgi:hypothetical protein